MPYTHTHTHTHTLTHLSSGKDARLKFIKVKRMVRRKKGKEKRRAEHKKLQRAREIQGKAVVTGQATLNSFVIYMSRFRGLKMWLQLLALAFAWLGYLAFAFWILAKTDETMCAVCLGQKICLRSIKNSPWAAQNSIGIPFVVVSTPETIPRYSRQSRKPAKPLIKYIYFGPWAEGQSHIQPETFG